MQLAKALVQFLQQDKDGNFGKVSSINSRNITVDLKGGVSVTIIVDSAKGIRIEDKMYFDDEGKFTKKIDGPKVESKSNTMPVQGCARVEVKY